MRFDPDDGSTPTQSTVKTGTLAAPPEKNPMRDGFQFGGWTLDSQPFDFQTPILQDTTLKAQWTKTTDWTLNPDHGPASGSKLTINPPGRQKPSYTSIQATGDQTVGLTGDGRIHTWAQDSTPKQVSTPAQAPDSFRYQQVAAGSRRQAALGSDQHIYTWISGQATPTIFDSEHNAGFTSISMNGDRLLAVDRQGRIHAYQAGQNPSPVLKEQAATSLSGKAQAVTAVASDSRALIVDADGQAWTWDANNTGNIKPARIKQDPGTRIIQVQALNQGLLLLDTNGHTYYLADSTPGPTVLSLPEGMKANRITVNKNQAMIVGEDGHVWSWKPGSKTTRADDGSQQYMQAAGIDGRITAIDRQGDMFTWSLNPQNNPGKPARLNTTQAPTLETAGIDGQPLKLTKNNDSWQAEIPARKPGEAAITITGRQDGQPFTRSLNYTVDQPLTREAEPGSTHTVTFDTTGGSQAPEPQEVSYPYGRVKRPSPDPTRTGYQFCGWFIGEIAYDFSKPVTEDFKLTAHWSPYQWTINPDQGNQLGKESTTITPPDISRGIKFNQVSSSNDYYTEFSLAVGSDGNAYAWGDNTHGQLGDGTTTRRTTPVTVQKPAGTPADFTYIQVSAGADHSLALGSDGYVYAWGYNSTGQLGNNGGYNTHSNVPVRVRNPDSPNDASKGLKATQISAGYELSLAISPDGNTWAWGWNAFGQLGYKTGAYASSKVPKKVLYPKDKGQGMKAIQVSAGSFHSMALGSDGYVYAWGRNNSDQLGNPAATNGNDKNPAFARVCDPDSPNDASKGLKATQISAGYEHSLAIDQDGNIWAWGNNDSRQLADAFGTSSVPRQVKYPQNRGKGVQAVQVSSGYRHSSAIDTDGNVWAWGGNDYGQLGDNTMNDRTNPAKVLASAKSTSSSGPWLNAVQVNGRGNHPLAIDTNGNVWAWGRNNNGQLGDGTTSDSKVPVALVFKLQPVITAARFDTSPGTNLTPVSNSSSVTVLTPAHKPGPVMVSVDYTIGGAGRTLTDTLTYTYLPAGTLPHAGGEGIMLALATGTVSMGGVLASRRHSREQHRLWHTSHE